MLSELRYDGPLSSFALKLNLCRYTKATPASKSQTPPASAKKTNAAKGNAKETSGGKGKGTPLPRLVPVAKWTCTLKPLAKVGPARYCSRRQRPPMSMLHRGFLSEMTTGDVASNS
jgi:hypothetical protein